jgi:alanine-glyoxylate transaminase / serine-glyoxylate transaminase / serine-pyruvate transaminase
MGPGPSEVPERVLKAGSLPAVGYLDPSFVELMKVVQKQLRYLFKTDNRYTMTITGAGTAAMECAIDNLCVPGDTVVCCVHGFFGDRMRQMYERANVDLHVVTAPWGQPIDLDTLGQTLDKLDKVHLVSVVHGETSTGVRQDIQAFSELVKPTGALLLVDTVASLGGVEFRTDDWGVDCVYTGSQKCLSAPPGLSPITFSDRAIEKIKNRKSPPKSWYLDVLLNWKYWDANPGYHHTGSIQTMYALHEALNLLQEEGLENRWERTTKTAEVLYSKLQNLGFKLFVAPENRLPTLTTTLLPEGTEEGPLRKTLLLEHNIEVAGGLGELAGKAWRVGLMGHSCREESVHKLHQVLSGLLASAGV